MMKHTIIAALVLSSFIFGCKKKDDTTPEAEATPTTTGTTGSSVNAGSTPQVKFSVDGTPYSYVQSMGSTPYLANGQANNGSLTGGVGTMTVGTLFMNVPGSTIMTIYKRNLNVTTSGTSNTVFANFFPKTTHPYYSSTVTDGVAISWFDASGTEWKSSNGSQTGSVFTIVDTQSSIDGNGEANMKVYATFNCKVYNSTGTVKTITNGQFVGLYINHL